MLRQWCKGLMEADARAKAILDKLQRAETTLEDATMSELAASSIRPSV